MTTDMRSVTRDLIIRLIVAEKDDPAEMKRRILKARDHGHLTDTETHDWLKILELEAA